VPSLSSGGTEDCPKRPVLSGMSAAPANATTQVFGREESSGANEYEVRIPVRFFKDDTISLEAKALLPILVAHADNITKETYVGNQTLQKLLKRKRAVIERALKELCETGWLRRKPQRMERGRWGKRILGWRIPKPDPCSDSRQRSRPATVRQATSHIPSQVRSPKKKSSFTSEKMTDAQNLSNGMTDPILEVIT
jgi:hypothetical protein